MMYYVYLLIDRYGNFYIGYTNNLKRRLKEHAKGKSNYLRKRRPIKLIYYEAFLSKVDARKRELTLKKYGSTLAQLKKRLKNSLKIVGREI